MSYILSQFTESDVKQLISLKRYQKNNKCLTTQLVFLHFYLKIFYIAFSYFLYCLKQKFFI